MQPGNTLFRTFLLGISLFAMGCAQQLGDIDRTQPNRLLKTELEGVWYYLETVTEMPPTSIASFIGETSKTEKIIWEIEEDYLFAYRAYPLIPGADNVEGLYEYGLPDYHENPVAAFPILSHFDIVRQYSSSTGEQSNVLEENAYDRPWYERDYIRVDWSTNVITNFDFISDWFSTPINGSYFLPEELGEENSAYFEYEEEELVYFDIPRQLLVEPDFWGCIFSWPWYAWGTEDCTAAQVEVVSSFAKTEAVRDYEPQIYDDQQMTRYGYFRSERYFYDYQRGVVESGRSEMINRLNIWEDSYHRGSDGEFLTDEEGRLIPIPMEDREVKTVPYYIAGTFPDDELMWDAAYMTLEEWNQVGREAVAVAQGADIEQVPDVFVLCDNPVRETDHEACGEAGFTVRRGDLRYSNLYYIDSYQLEGPLGYGPSAVDPVTGETISAKAHVYGDALNTYASYALDIVRFMNGDLDPAELMDAEHVRELIQSHSLSATGMDRVAPELRDMPLRTNEERDPERFAHRHERRENLRPFDRSAAMNALESAVDSGLGPRAGGQEFYNIVANRLNTPVGLLTEEQLDLVDPAFWMSPMHMQEQRQRRMSSMARGVCYSDMLDPNVLGLAREYEGRTDYDQIWRELRAEIFRAVALHEVGHTVGLRHNFAATYDSMNYFDEYWDMRVENMAPVTSVYDLYAQSEVTESQLNGRMLEYAYSSVMDYGLAWNTDLHGLGKYDRTAFIYGYTGGTSSEPTADVENGCEGEGYREDPMNPGQCLVSQRGFVEIYTNRLNELGPAGEILTSQDTQGFYMDDPTIPIIPYLERWHYTTVMQSFPGMSNAFSREFMRLDEFVAAREEGAEDMPVRVPYLFCSDEYYEGWASCQVFDGGADPFEQIRNIINDYRAYYYFVNFKRDKMLWDPWNALYSYLFYTFMPISNLYQNWYLAPYGDDTVMDEYWWMAINSGFNLFAEALFTPQYGVFCEGPEGRYVPPWDDFGENSRAEDFEYFLDVYCAEDGEVAFVPQGQGRRKFSAYDTEAGYDYAWQYLEAGHYYATLAAVFELFDPDAYVLGSDGDLGFWSISFYDYFEEEIHAIMNSIMTENYNQFSPVMEFTGETDEMTTFYGDMQVPTGNLHYPVASPTYDSGVGFTYNPETGQNVEEITGPFRTTDWMPSGYEQSVAVNGICEPCNVDGDCAGYTGFYDDVFCSPMDDSWAGERFCMQDCTNDPTLCGSDETCQEYEGWWGDTGATCVPDTGSCEGLVFDCSLEHPNGSCGGTGSCVDGVCEAIWPIIESDTTWSTFDDFVWYGFLFSTFSFSTRFNDQTFVFKVGTDEEREPAEGFSQVTFSDPVSGDIYGALAENCDAADPSVRCRFGFSTEAGGVQMIIKGQQLAETYNEALEAYWTYEGTDSDLDNYLWRKYSNARWSVESHVQRINIIRAVYDFWGMVY